MKTVTLLKSKIHRATVTQSELDYEGSITIDRELLILADIAEYEQVHVWNVTRGTRLVTYAIEGESGSGVVCVNGAGAHLNQVGDIVIIAAFVGVDMPSANNHHPLLVHVDGKNHVTKVTTG